MQCDEAASITPIAPYGFHLPPVAEPRRSPAEYRRIAEATRAMATGTDDPALRRLRLQLAMMLMTLATEVERLEAMLPSMQGPPLGPAL